MRTLPLVAFAAILLAVPAVRADLAPPGGFVESCTVERQQVDGLACLLCEGAYHGDVDFCERTYAASGLTRACRTRGASVWGEVWCGTPEQLAAAQGGGGAPQLGSTTGTDGTGTAPDGAADGAPAPAEASGVPAAEGSVPAAAATPSTEPAQVAEPTPEPAAAAEAPAATPEPEGAPTPGRRGCAAGAAAPLSAALAGWLAAAVLGARRRRAGSRAQGR